MNIAQGLKEKNRIAGKISRLERQVNQHNRYFTTDQPDLNAAELFASLTQERSNLIDIKSRIAKANAGIVHSLVELEEAKSELTFWESRLTNHGPALKEEEARIHVNNEWVWIPKEKISIITTKDVYDNQERVQRKICELQDAVDAYNATTKI